MKFCSDESYTAYEWVRARTRINIADGGSRITLSADELV